MVIGIIGESCAGKSTLAAAVKQRFGGEVVTGKDYLRLAKSEGVAEKLFRKKLAEAMAGEHMIYVITEMAHLAFLPAGAVRILVKADLETIKTRFAARMRGNLPAPVAQMLERNHGCFDDLPCDLVYDGASGDVEALCEALAERLIIDS